VLIALGRTIQISSLGLAIMFLVIGKEENILEVLECLFEIEA
jgi:hypothetical protein